MRDESPHLQLRIDGGPADRHRVSLNDLTTIVLGIQGAVRNVGAVLAGHATGKGGRKPGWIEQATELVLVAEPAGGCVQLELELSGDTPSLDVEAQRLGPTALDAFVDGLATLATNKPLPRGFDPGVLKALSTMAPVFRKGYESIALTIGHDGDSRRAAITSERLAVVGRLTQEPLSAPASVDGVLIAVDLAGDPLTCRVDRPFLPSVTCLIPRSMREIVKTLIEHRVHAEGVGEFEAGADDPRRLRVAKLVGADSGHADRTAWREHRPWQEHTLAQGTNPLRTEGLPSLFDDDDDLDRFLAAAHGQPAS